VDSTDPTLLFTAEREAVEEMARLPQGFEVIKEVVTRRGKRMQKWYKVFVAKISDAEREAFKPSLNKEHVEYRWFDVNQLGSLLLHPVVKRILPLDL